MMQSQDEFPRISLLYGLLKEI